MGDIWLPGLPPAYVDYAACLAVLAPLMPTHQDAVVLAAIAGNESGYDYRVINDTPATGDYSVGLWQINYYDGLAAGRTAAYGTPRALIESGLHGQARAAADLWHSAGGFSPWAADIIGNKWQRWVGSGPVPANPTLGGLGQIAQADAQMAAEARRFNRLVRTLSAQLVWQRQAADATGGIGWTP